MIEDILDNLGYTNLKKKLKKNKILLCYCCDIRRSFIYLGDDL